MTSTSKALLLVTASLILSQNSRTYAEEAVNESFGSVEERRIDASIMQERANVRKEREDIDLHKKELKTLEEAVDKKLADIDAKLIEMKNLQKKIDASLTAKTAEEKKRIQNLAIIYEKMVPAKAALALSGLEQGLAADLLANMKAKAAAKILDQLAKQKTTELSTTFSTIQLE